MGKIKGYTTVDDKVPTLRVALTSQCNLSYIYCPPKGENFINTENSFSTEKLLSILNIFY